MRRREFVVNLGLANLGLAGAWPLVAQAQQTNTWRRHGRFRKTDAQDCPHQNA